MELQANPRRVLELLAAYAGSEGELLSDEELNAALDPFRGSGPLPVHCGLEGCKRRFSWWALPVRGRPPFPEATPAPETGFVYGNGLWPVEGARVIHSSWGPRRAEVRSPAGSRVQSWHPDPYEDWSVGVVTHEDDAKMVNPARLEFLFTCRRERCGEPYILTNKEMIALLVTTIAGGKEEIRLSPQRARKGL